MLQMNRFNMNDDCSSCLDEARVLCMMELPMRRDFFIAESHANILVSFATAVREAGGTCVAERVAHSDSARAAGAAGQLVDADWPDSADAVTDRWENMRASKLVVEL